MFLVSYISFVRISASDCTILFISLYAFRYTDIRQYTADTAISLNETSRRQDFQNRQHWFIIHNAISNFIKNHNHIAVV